MRFEAKDPCRVRTGFALFGATMDDGTSILWERFHFRMHGNGHQKAWAWGTSEPEDMKRPPPPSFRSSVARIITAAEAAKVLFDEWDMHGEGFIGELTCHSSDEFGEMDADLDGEWVRFSEIESVLRAMSQKA